MLHRLTNAGTMLGGEQGEGAPPPAAFGGSTPAKRGGHCPERSEDRSARAYPLLEVLLAIGVIAVLLGITIPQFAQSFAKSPGEEAADAMALAVREVRASAVEKGESRQILILTNGIEPAMESVPAVRLPQGWRLGIRRMTESKFRKPEKKEKWSFNGAGISEPITFELRGPDTTMELAFDPLTGLVLDE